jgi:pimeloyl-ACP methyl ester carboxylesterase
MSALATFPASVAQHESVQVHYQVVRISDVDIFYREAGAKSAPVLLLLHGFPTSSSMFRNLIPRLAASFHVIAPDYPGYGFSGMPDRKSFSYTFENMTNIVEEFTEKLQLTKYTLYVMDYGAPIGYRLALRHPERVAGFIVQNGNAYEEVLERCLAREPRGPELLSDPRRYEVAVSKRCEGPDPARSHNLDAGPTWDGSSW